jgi:hypothetical protein
MVAQSLARKLLIKSGTSVRFLESPQGFAEALEGAEPAQGGTSDVVVVFAASRADLDRLGPQGIASVRPGGILWIAYRKGGRSDLKRETVWEGMRPTGWRPVTQIALDEEWSALRFRPEDEVGR